MIGVVKRLRSIAVVLLFGWMLFLHWVAYAQISQKPIIDIERLTFSSRLKKPNLGTFLPAPTIELKPRFLELADVPMEFHKDAAYERLTKIFKMQESGSFQEAYVAVDKLQKSVGKTGLGEWLSYLRADLLYQVQTVASEKRWALALEDYQDAIRRNPLSTQFARILYQISLLQLELGFFQDAEETTARGLREYGKTEFAPYYYLIRGEGSFRRAQYPQASLDFGNLIDEFPRSSAAIDAAFRKAFIHFAKAEFDRGYAVYRNLEKYHSDEIERLRLKKDYEGQDRYLDRVYYAETIFLNGLYDESAKLFQDLANLFPQNPLAPLLLARLADTYFERGQFKAADQLYQVVINNPTKSVAQSFAKVNRADALFLTRDVRAHRENETLYLEAREEAEGLQQNELAAYAVERLASYLLFFGSYAKAQLYLEEIIESYPGTSNHQWAEVEYIKTLERQIIEYVERGDPMAGLAIYLAMSKERKETLRDPKVFLILSQAARNLELYDQASDILTRLVYLEKTVDGRQEALLRLVDLLIARGETKKAGERLRRFNFAYPKSKYPHLYERLWGDLYSALKNSEKAVKHYEAAMEIAASKPALQFEMRDLYLKIAQHLKSLALPMRAVEAYQRYVAMVMGAQEGPPSERKVTEKDLFLAQTSRFRIADSFFDMKDFVRALESYRELSKSVKQEPFASHARFRMGECLLELGDKRAALEVFKEIRSENQDNLWARAAQSYIKTVEMEVKYGIRIIN